MFDTVPYSKRGGRSEGRSRKSPQHGSGHHRRLLCEALEARALLSGSAFVQLPQGKLTASDGAASAQFGHAVAVSGTTMVVGALHATVGGNSNQGAAYVFTESGSTWTPTAKLTASDGAAGAVFGSSVAISGNTIVVGADGFVNGISRQGAAYVFTESGSVWTQTAKLTASDGQAGDWFGCSVSINESGNTVVVGATYAKVGGNTAQGAAYEFTESNSAWTQAAELTASDGAAYSYFGHSVSISGNTVVVGDYLATVNGNVHQGAAYVFTEPGSGWANMTQTAEFTTSGGAADSYFGNSVSISGNTVVVGDYFATVNGNAAQGAAYVFTEPGSGWANMTQTAEFTTSGGAANDSFGSSVAISGNTIVAGADFAWGGNVKQGAAYVFAEPASGWANMTQTQKLTASDGATDDSFGVSVSFSGSTLVVGAPAAWVGSNADQGAAYVFGSANLGFTQTSTPPDTINVAYNNQTITAVRGTGTVTLSVGKIRGAISGLTVTSSGTGVTISGTPTATGTETFAVTAKDQGGDTASATYSITVNPILTLSATPLPAGTVGVAYGYVIGSSGGTGGRPIMVASNVENAIPGLVLSLGTITGTPTAPGTETFTVTATDAVGYTVSANYSITIFTTPTTQSSNWSGYAVATSPGAVTDVKGSWTEPALQSPSAANTYSSFWVGIDGYNSSTVEQIGTCLYTNASGQAVYYAWYEMYPQEAMVSITTTTTNRKTHQTTTTDPVYPGDTMNASVQYTGSNTFLMTITDDSQGWTFAISQAVSIPPAAQSSAEWIAEAPSSSSGVLPLADFGTVSFSAASATISGTTGPIDSTAWPAGNPIAIDMVGSSGIEAYPSVIVDNTSGTTTTSTFSISFVGAQNAGNGAMMDAPVASTTASGNPSAFLSPVTTGSDGAGYAVGTKLQPDNALVTSASLKTTPARKLGDRTVRALPDEAVDLALVDFKGIGPDDALLSVLAAGRMR